MKFDLTQYEMELKVLLLGTLSFILWSLSVHYVLSIMIYLVLFAYLYYKKAPITHYLVVVMFAMISRNTENYRNYDYVLIGILSIYTIIKVIKNKSITLGKLSVIMVINLIYSIISLSYTPVFLDGLFGIGSFLQGYLTYFIITNHDIKFTKDSFLKFSKIASLFLLFITIQFAFKYVVEDVRNVDDVKKAINLGWQIANLAAPFFVFLIPIALYKYTLKDKVFYHYFFLDLLNIGGLILSLSRGAYMGLALALLLFLLFNIRNWTMIKRYGSVVLGLLVGASLLPFVRNAAFTLFNSFIGKNFFDDNARYSLWELAFNKFLEKPITGQGINASNYLIPTFLNGRENHFFHNFILQTAATMGIIGLIILVIFLFKIARVMVRPQNTFILLVGAGIAGALLHQVVDVMFDMLMFGMFFYGLVAFVEVYRNQDIEDNLKLKTIIIR